MPEPLEKDFVGVRKGPRNCAECPNPCMPERPEKENSNPLDEGDFRFAPFSEGDSFEDSWLLVFVVSIS